jgi:hypothetical protein
MRHSQIAAFQATCLTRQKVYFASIQKQALSVKNLSKLKEKLHVG